MVSTNKRQHDEKVPFLAQATLAFYSFSPKVTICGLDFGFSLLSMAFFAVMRCVMKQFVLNNLLEWPLETAETNFSAACLVGGIFHTPFLCLMLGMLLTSRPFRPAARFDEYPPWWQDTCHAMLQLCTGYMIYDFSVILWDRYHENNGTIVLNESDPLYMAHHFMTSFYMISVRLVGAGQGSALICMFLGEITNPFFNTYLALEDATKIIWCCQSAAWFTTLHRSMEFCSAASYVLVRAVIAPFVLGVYTCGHLLLRNPTTGGTPLWLRLLYCLLIWAVLLGSGSWIEKFWLEVLSPYWNQLSVAAGEL